MAADTARGTSDACKGMLRLHPLRDGLPRDQAFPVTRCAGPDGKVGLGSSILVRITPESSHRASILLLLERRVGAVLRENAHAVE